MMDKVQIEKLPHSKEILGAKRGEILCCQWKDESPVDGYG
jgi:hypothetical protein